MTHPSPPAPVVRRYAGPPGGQVHLAVAAPPAGRPGEPVADVVLLHQTPRSWDEYRDVLPLLAARGLRAAAVDTPGFGASDPPPQVSVAAWADGVEVALDALRADAGAGRPLVLVGHHTGGVVAVEVAARRGAAVSGLVLSSTPLTDAAFRSAPAHGVDDVEVDGSGAHLRALWDGRARFYPAGRPDLLERFVRDALTAGPALSSAGHRAVRGYVMEDRLPRVAARVLLVGAPDDPYGYPNLARMAAALPAAGVTRIPGGTVPLPDQLPREYADVVAGFALQVAR